MRCNECGAEAHDGMKFCNQCAAPLNSRCPKCGRDNAADAKFCGRCAAPLACDGHGTSQPITAIPDGTPRRPGVATILSLLCPGWGQIYNGQFSKAVWIAVGWLSAYVCALAIGVGATFSGFVALGVASVAIYLLVCAEAVSRARRIAAEHRQSRRYRWYAYVGFVAIAYVLSLSAAMVARQFLVQAYKLPSGAMEPTLLVGDDIMVDKLQYGLRLPDSVFGFTPLGGEIPYGHYLFRLAPVHRGDVVVFVFPLDPTKDFIKRVIGIGGDTVAVRDGAVYLNGKRMADAHAHFEIPSQDRSASSPRDYFGPVTVPKGEFFMMGDNRDRSWDSRFWGFVKLNEIEGRATFIVGRNRLGMAIR